MRNLGQLRLAVLVSLSVAACADTAAGRDAQGDVITDLACAAFGLPTPCAGDSTAMAPPQLGDPGPDDPTPAVISFELNGLQFVNASFPVTTSWGPHCDETTCGTPYTVSITCDGAGCDSDVTGEVFYGLHTFAITPRAPGRVHAVVTLTDSWTQATYAGAGDVTILPLDDLHIECRDLRTNTACATPIASGTPVALAFYAVSGGDTLPLYPSHEVDAPVIDGQEPTECQNGLTDLGTPNDECAWDSLTLTTTVTVSFAAVSRSVQLVVE